MRNLLPQHYIKWLNRFKEAHPNDKSAQKKVKELIEDLRSIESFEQCDSLFKKHLNPLAASHNSGELTEFPYYLPINLLNQLTSWQKEIQGILEQHSQALKVLADCQSVHADNCLLTMLQAILTQSTHVNTRSLLSSIGNEQFPSLLAFLCQLKQVPIPEKPQAGSYTAINPCDNQHHQCIVLLNSLCAVYDEQNTLCRLGNDVLQVSILAYEDLHLDEKLESDEIQTEPSQEMKIEWCTLV